MMRTMMLRGGVVLSLLAALGLFAGCSGTKEQKKADDKTEKDGKQPKKDDDDDTSDDGFWCNKHGIPEDDCSICSAKVEKECKAKGDWCEQHNRAKSQC